MRSQSRFLSVVFLFCLLGASTAAAFAQSTDSSNPTPLTTSQLQGEAEANGQSYFYSFTGGPGDITVGINGSTDYYSTNTHLIFCDDKERELANVGFAATSSGASKVATFHLAQKQPIKMQLMFGLDVGVHVKYRISLNGATPPASSPVDSATVADSARGDSGKDSKSASGITSSEIKSTDITSDDLKSTADETAVGSLNRIDYAAPIEDKWAFVVGISKFQSPAIDLRYSAKDARDFYNYLINEAHFAPDHVKLLLDEQATKERVLADLGDKWLPRLAGPNDLVVIFISSHGSPSQADLEGLNYLVMHNTDPDSLYATGLPLEDLAAAIRHRVHADRVVLIIDACHSGSAAPAKGLRRVGNVDSDALLQGTGQLIICSSQPNQVSWESKRYENGVFTHQLIESLRWQSGKLTLGQAFERLRASAQSEVLQDRGELQTAVWKSKWQGNALILSIPPTKPRPVPEELKGDRP